MNAYMTTAKSRNGRVEGAEMQDRRWNLRISGISRDDIPGATFRDTFYIRLRPDTDVLCMRDCLTVARRWKAFASMLDMRPVGYVIGLSGRGSGPEP